jgi:hypothetical protein
MAKKYVFVRMPVDIYNIYKGIKEKMEVDLKRVTNRNIKMPMPKVFRAVASPEYNENYITIPLQKMIKLGKVMRK